MKKIFLLLFLIQVALCQAQETYKYMRVPEKFGFLKEENKYQLNALTAFLFEKYGFEALYKENNPAGVNPCEILTADVESNSGLFRSRLVVHLKDCNQRTVFTSEEGISSEKEYKKSYHEALREAFESLEKLAAVMPEYSGNAPATTTNNSAIRSIEKLTGKEKKGRDKTSAVRSVEPGSKKIFRNGEQVYELEKDSSGFSLFKSGEEEEFATLVESGNGTNYIYTSKNLQGNAFFDPAGNLVVEYVDPNINQLVSIKYQLQD